MHFKSELRPNGYRDKPRQPAYETCIWNFQHWMQILAIQVQTLWVQRNLQKRYPSKKSLFIRCWLV